MGTLMTHKHQVSMYRWDSLSATQTEPGKDLSLNPCVQGFIAKMASNPR
jgi:hypothetical protein